MAIVEMQLENSYQISQDRPLDVQVGALIYNKEVEKRLLPVGKYAIKQGDEDEGTSPMTLTVTPDGDGTIDFDFDMPTYTADTGVMSRHKVAVPQDMDIFCFRSNGGRSLEYVLYHIIGPSPSNN